MRGIPRPLRAPHTLPGQSPRRVWGQNKGANQGLPRIVAAPLACYLAWLVAVMGRVRTRRLQVLHRMVKVSACSKW